MISSAEISPCGQYRYVLRRIWDESLPTLVFVMLNPSTADATEDELAAYEAAQAASQEADLRFAVVAQGIAAEVSEKVKAALLAQHASTCTDPACGMEAGKN